METFGGSCRLCLWKGDKMISLFPGRENIISKIKLCLPIQVDMDDNLPKEICYECNYKLQIFSEFYQTCIRSNKILKQYSSQIRKNLKPEIKLETEVEVVEDSDFTSNGSILKSKVDTVNHSIQSLNSETGGLGSTTRSGIKHSENTIPCKWYNNELSAKNNNSNINKVSDNDINPSNSSCIHNRQTYGCCYKCNNCRNGTSLDTNSLSKSVNIKDSLRKNNVLFSKSVRTNNDCEVESVPKTCQILCSSSSSRSKINSRCSLDHTDMDGCELENCKQRLPYKNSEKLPNNCDNLNYLQTTFEESRRSCEIQRITYPNVAMNCYQENKETSDQFTLLNSESINKGRVYKRKHSSTKIDDNSVLTHSDEDNEKNTGFKEIMCTPVNEDINVCTVSELITDGSYSDIGKESKNALRSENYRKYYVNIRNVKKTARTRGRMKSDPKKGRRSEKMKIKKKINKNIGSIVVQKIYSCRYCNRKYSSVKWCLKHEQSHIKGRKYKCTECNSSFLSSLQLNKHDCIELFRLHIKNDHSYCTNKLENDNEVSSPNATETCDKCGKVFHSILSFSEHSQNCLIKICLRNTSDFKKKNIFNKPQERIKKYISVKMKSSLRNINSV